MKFGVKAVLPAPTESIKILPDSTQTDRLIETHVRLNEAQDAVVDQVLNRRNPEDMIVTAPDGTTQEHVPERAKLSKLVSDDFPFDESQLEAINGIANQRYACLTGAAGTGKTTSTKAIVDRIHEGVGSVDMTNYFKKSDVPVESVDSDDEYETPDAPIPSIAMVGFTGRSTQMIKKNFPRDWHGNIMTIHRLLAFMPEFFERYDVESGDMRKTMRFVPTYNRDFLLPWDVIIIDEAGMVSLDLWEQLWEACKPGTRIIMIGDINQLPPVHGRSIFGFAMTTWPSWELTHIHRQEGKNNSIVDNAWKILKGIMPTSDEYQSDPTWKFAMMQVPEDSALASQKIRAWLAKMNGKAYQPHRDSVITAINGEDTSRGYALGQLPMNRELAVVFNKDNPRYIIDAGRVRQHFAEGDKVMATRNDHEAGITNGMTGIITKIERNGAYAGDTNRFGTVDEVSRYMASQADDTEDEEFSLDDISESFQAVNEGIKNSKESRDRGPASHIVTVRFGTGEHGFEMPFATLAEVATLMTAYVVTCHKMQGGESPLVVVICHQSHKAMLNREWLYTAVTRASQKCVVFFTPMGLRAALNKQRITGTTLAQKVTVFQELQTRGLVGAALNVRLPERESLGTELVERKSTMLEQKLDEAATAKADTTRTNAFERMKERAREVNVRIDKVEIHTHHHHHTIKAPPPPPTPSPVIQGGRIVPHDWDKNLARMSANMAHRVLTLDRRDVVVAGPIRHIHGAGRPAPLRLTHQPKPAESTPKPGSLAFLMKGKK